MSLKIIGAGFGRTGTSSLKRATEVLGYGPCYHMNEIARNSSHPSLWLKALKERDIDWDLLFSNYKSVLDWPACSFYRQLHSYYPEARVILTVRDADEWYQSAKATIYANSRSSIWPLFYNPSLYKRRQIRKKLIWEETFKGRFLADPELAKSIFKKHIEEVKNTIPPRQLLVYQVSQGWEPLCKFFDVDVPDMPFPHTNTRSTFKTKGILKNTNAK